MLFPVVASGINLIYLFITAKRSKNITNWHSIVNYRYIKQVMICCWGYFLLLPFIPFVRFLYKSLKMLNNPPPDLADNVTEDHKNLRDLFDFEPVTLEMEITRWIKEK